MSEIAILVHDIALQNNTWNSVSDLTQQHPIQFSENVHTPFALAAPGGNLGELILLLSATEKLLPTQLDKATIKKTALELSQRDNHFTLLCSTESIEQLFEQMRSDTNLSAWASAQPRSEYLDSLQNPPKLLRNYLLKFVSHVENLGNEHLQQMYSHPLEFSTRPGLIKQVIAVFFQCLWEGEEHFELLVDGDNCMPGIAITLTHNDYINGHTLVPHSPQRLNDRPILVNNTIARKFLHDKHSLIVNQCLIDSGYRELNIPALRDEIERLSHKQWRARLKNFSRPFIHHSIDISGKDIYFDKQLISDTNTKVA